MFLDTQAVRVESLMKKWRVEVIPSVEIRFIDILTYISDDPLHNPEAASAVFDDFEATLQVVGLMGDRIPIGSHPIMRDRKLRRVNFQKHNYYLIYRLADDVAQIVRIGHFREDLDNVLK